MALGARTVKKIETATAVAARLFGAPTEQAVFAVLSEVCAAESAETRLAGYSVGPDGRAVRPMTGPDGLSERIPISDVERWLLRRGEPPSTVGRIEGACEVVWQRLIVEHRVVGGFVLAGPRFDETDRRRCDVFACLAAGAIVGLREKCATEARLHRRERELRALAFHDPLTGLANRLHLTRERLPRLEAGIASGEVSGCVLFVVGLKDFGPTVDIHGRAWGDRILESVAERLSHGALRADAVLRLGDDVFGVLFERALETRALAAIADRMIEMVGEPVRHGERLLRPEASIGIAPFAGRDAEIGSLLGDAELALQEARKQKAGAFRFFAPSLRKTKIERLTLVDDIRRALSAREFELHYQPQFSTRSGRLVGFEALARWPHPARGQVPPSTFIPLMEEHGLIEALGEWALRTACAEARHWPDDVIVAVNVSPLQVHGARFSLILADTLLRSGLPPRRLELEITESVFLADEARTRAELASWKALGVGIALDDFGYGYSSLGYLGVFPIDKIKIDRGFLARFDPRRPEDDAGVVLRAIIDLGLALGIGVTAEGVETPDQLDHLRRNGCAEAQGFLLGRPMPAAQVHRFLRDHAESAAGTAARRHRSH
jgi:diguanylate cyclase (GGDEF)-like protein